MKIPLALLLPALGGMTLVPCLAAGPIVIDHGGTWTGGTYESWDSSVPAIKITTTQPVTLYKCTVGGNADLISAVTGGAQVTIRDCKGTAAFSKITGRVKGFFFTASEPASVVIQNNTIIGTGGINIVGFQNTLGTKDTIKIVDNLINNVDGRKSLGTSSQADNDTHPELRHAVMLNSVHAVPKILIAWNQMINEPGNSSCEDVIDFFQSNALSGSPAVIADNYIQGAYPPKPESQNYSGGGINLGDVIPGDKNAADIPAYADCFDNQVINTCNYGIGIFDGHHMSLHNNTVLCSGKFGNGENLRYTFVGSLSWDYAGIGNWHDNRIYDNWIGYEQNNFSNDVYTGQKLNNYWAKTALRDENNSGPTVVTQTMEKQEWVKWQKKISSHHLKIGTDW